MTATRPSSVLMRAKWQSLMFPVDLERHLRKNLCENLQSPSVLQANDRGLLLHCKFYLDAKPTDQSFHEIMRQALSSISVG